MNQTSREDQSTLAPTDLSQDDTTDPHLPSESQPAFSQIGDYEVLGEIARGGMGVVYKARHTQLGRLAAVKLIKSGELAATDEIRRFQVEAQAVAGLDHSGIVTVYEVGQQQGQPFMAMAFIAGESLWQKVKEAPFAPQEAARLMQQVADAVQYAHDKGIIHRDLKPHNILLTAQGQPKVTDFGLAKKQSVDSSLTATGQALGTPSYMPPEQVSGKNELVGPLADVYSLGATLYCLLTGRPPFQAATALDTMLQVLERSPVPPRQLNPAIPRDLETICLKCLEKVPAQRYSSASELALELDRYLKGEPILARPVSRWERYRRWCRRNPLVASLSATALGLLIGGTLISTYFAVLASRRAARAEEGTRIAIETLETVIFQMQEKLGSIPAARAARMEVLKQAMKEMEKLADLQVQSGRLDLGRAVVLTRYAAIIFTIGSDDTLGSMTTAEKYLDAACKTFEKYAADDPKNLQARQEWGYALVKAGDVAINLGKLDRAREFTQHALQLFRELQVEDPNNLLSLKQLCYTLIVAGDVAMSQGDPAGALEKFREAKELVQPLFDAHPENAGLHEFLIMSTEKLADAQLRLGDADSAHLLYKENLQQNLDYLRNDPADPSRMYSLSFCYERLAEFATRRNEPEKSVEYYQQELDILIQAIETDPKNRKYQQEIQVPLRKATGLYRRLNRTADAEAAEERVHEVLAKVR